MSHKPMKRGHTPSSSHTPSPLSRQLHIPLVSSVSPSSSSSPSSRPGSVLNKFFEFNMSLSSSVIGPFESKSLDYWSAIVSKFFAPEARLKYRLVSNLSKSDCKTIVARYPILPRFFLLHFLSGVSSLQFHLVNPVEVFGNILDVPHASIIQTFNNQTKVIAEGQLRVTYNLPQLQIVLFEFKTNSFCEYVPKSLLLNEGQDESDFDDKFTTEFGLPMRVMRCLEMAEICYNMSEIMEASVRSSMGPMDIMYKSFPDEWKPFLQSSNGTSTNFSHPRSHPSYK